MAMQRSERREQEELTGKKKLAATFTPEERLINLLPKGGYINSHLPRTARPGKPLKRSRR